MPQNIEQLKESLPDFAKDIRLNLSSVLQANDSSGLTQNQIFGVALASAYATRSADVIEAVAGEAAALSPEEVNAAKAAATIMAMSNVYYRSTYMTGDDEFGKLPAGLRMNVIGNPGIDKVTFELYALGVSAINGCSACIAAHNRTAQEHGVSKVGVQHVFRIAAVVFAAAQAAFIQGEAA
ncbi:MAG: carboxymuconolactone decarboxylase family protein [Alphaproteobacteria bacterium]